MIKEGEPRRLRPNFIPESRIGDYVRKRKKEISALQMDLVRLDAATHPAGGRPAFGSLE
jgi:hypothetical protein